MTIVDLFARIGLKTDEAKAKSFSRSMNTLKNGMVVATATAVGVSAAINKITNDAMKMGVAFKQFEVETGASAQELQKWQSVVEQTNQPIESVTSAIKALATSREKIKLGQGDISGYQLLGIDPNKDPFEILEDLRIKTQGLSQAMKKDILSKFGVGSGMIQALEMTNEEFNKLSANAFIIQPSAITTLNQAKASMDLAGRAIDYMKSQIAVGLSPQIVLLTKRITAFIKKNEDGIIKGFQLSFKWVSKFTDAIINTVSWIDTLVTKTIGWKNGIIGVMGVLALLNTQLILSPIGLMTAGLLLLIAVMDDIKGYSEGKNSLFGKMMDGMAGFKTFIDGIINAIKIIKDFMDGGDLDFVTGAADVAREEGKTVKANTLDFWGAGVGTDRFYNAAPRWMKTDWYKQVFSGGGFGNLTGEESRNMNTTNNVTITVNGTADAEDTAIATMKLFEKNLSGTSAQISRDE